ncbi:hypothetical protein ACWE42_14615 [Sutcliffiella cohnii]
MLFNKEIRLNLEDSAVTIENQVGSGIILLTVSEFEVSAEKSTSTNVVYTEKNKTQICLDANELKEVVKALNEVIEMEDEE